jgi:two-component system chemotaxis response regulator CheY
VVDDEPTLRRLLARVLEGAGFLVLEAENGRDALQRAGTSPGYLSLVVTDISMPVMSGLEFVTEFRLLHPSTPVLFISGKAPQDWGLAGNALAFGDLLKKPFSPDVLLATVSRMLSQADVGRATA